MKKIIFVLLASLILVFTFAACGNTESEYTAGTVIGNTYTSDWLGLSFTASEDILLSSDEELAELDLGDEICEMLATNLNTYNSVSITVNPKAFASAEEYLEMLKQNYSATGMAVSYDEISETEIAGAIYSEAKCDISYQGFPLKIAVYLRSIGDNTACILISYDSEEELNSFLNCFSAAK